MVKKQGLTVFILLFSLNMSISYAQSEINMVEKLHIAKDIDSLEKRISYLISKNDSLSKMQGLKQYHIFELSYDDYKENRENMMSSQEFYDSCYKNNIKVNFEDYTHYYNNYNDKYKLSKGEIRKSILDYSFLDKLQINYEFVWYREINIPLVKYFFKQKKKYFIQTSTLITDSLGNLIGYADANFVPYGYSKSTIKLAKMFFEKEVDFVFTLSSPFTLQTFFIKDSRIYVINNSLTDFEIYSLEEFVECCYDKLINKNEKK